VRCDHFVKSKQGQPSVCELQGRHGVSVDVDLGPGSERCGESGVDDTATVIGWEGAADAGRRDSGLCTQIDFCSQGERVCTTASIPREAEFLSGDEGYDRDATLIPRGSLRRGEERGQGQGKFASEGFDVPPFGGDGELLPAAEDPRDHVLVAVSVARRFRHGGELSITCDDDPARVWKGRLRAGVSVESACGDCARTDGFACAGARRRLVLKATEVHIEGVLSARARKVGPCDDRTDLLPFAWLDSKWIVRSASSSAARAPSDRASSTRCSGASPCRA